MPSERVLRRIDQLLDQADEAVSRFDWQLVLSCTRAVLGLDPENTDALTFLAAAEQNLAAADPTRQDSTEAVPPDSTSTAVLLASNPNSFAGGRYLVQRFLGEGGKKRVYLAHDTLLDRDVAFALIKAEGLDDIGRVRIRREAQAMGRLGNHPNIVSVYDIGDETGQPYLVLPILTGGDVEDLIAKTPEHRLPLEQALQIAIDTCSGLMHAHAKGIIHRDIKPGNIWLTEDGRAMIGDFGLVIAAGRSRLTQVGMMVGTASYMPPEQAMGGEIGHRSDLYSLGAMLYEMVCGRPPFVGDESVAIIGQHLNTPPVSPTWHRPDCPPALEALLLRLLEKDPSRRPESALAVKEALQAIEQSSGETARAAPPNTQPPPTSIPQSDPLYRRTFVGRENEVRQLQQAFDAALSGQGGLLMVVGEPGIGKTAICEQLATYVALRGGKALVGHCYEEGSLSLPYLAFAEAMRSYVLGREPDGLRSDLGTGAADVARIVSEVRDRVQGIEVRPTGDLEDDRWRLLQSLTSFLRNASTVQPLVIVLEDLHWADRGTLDLLLHVSRNLTGARLLIVGTYRDVEVDRTHPLSATLAELGRATSFQRVRLRGLSIDEVHRMYEAIRGQATPWAQAEAVHRQTEGNPLFVQEVLRYLVEEGIVVREDGHYVPQQGIGAGIPEGLRDVVGKRLSRLSSECNRLLAIAAVIGRDFDLATLRGVANQAEEPLLSAIEEAVRVGVLEERPMPGAVRYRFAHAFFRQSLYEEMIAPRRLRLHQEVARALEVQYGSRVADHASELAEHYGQSTDRADLAKAVEYSEAAAARAMSVFAYLEAVSHLERCLQVQDVLDPDNQRRRCDLLNTLAEALGPSGNAGAALEKADEAFFLADALGDDAAVSRACRSAYYSLVRLGISPVRALWTERADRHATGATEERIHADIAVGSQLNGEGMLLEGRISYRKALAFARELGKPQELFRAALFLLMYGDEDERLSLAQEFAMKPPDGVIAVTLSGILWAGGLVLLARGDRSEAEELWRQQHKLAEHTRDPLVVRHALDEDMILAIVNGRFESLNELWDRNADQFGGGHAISISIMRKAAWYTGATPRLIEARVEETPLVTQLLRFAELKLEDTLLRFLLPSPDAIPGYVREAAGFLTNSSESANAEYPLSHHAVIFLLDMCVEVRAMALLPDLVRRCAYFPEVFPLAGTGVTGLRSPGRLLGEASSVLGQVDQARGYFEKALSACEKVGFRPEIALIRLDLAELLLEHYPDERASANQHLDFVIPELASTGMQPALERALRMRGRRRPAASQRIEIYPDGLSEREVEVLKLIAQGRSNPQIADALVISRSTVQNHVSNILTKAGLANRAEAAAYAERHNLT